MIPNQFDNNDHVMNDDGSPGDDSSMPIGTGEFSAESGFAIGDSAGGGNRHMGSALLLTVVVAIAIAGLFSMRTLTRASAAIEPPPSDVEQSIESFLAMIQGSQAKKTEEDDGALDVLAASYTQRQVALSDVQRNPFIIVETSESPRTDTRQEDVDPLEEKRRILKSHIDQAAERLMLRSVLMGSDPLANINNQVVRVGDTITVGHDDVMFLVRRITSESVTLVAGDRQLGVKVTVTVNIRRNH